MSSCDKEPVITNDMINEMKQSISGKWIIDYLIHAICMSCGIDKPFKIKKDLTTYTNDRHTKNAC